MTRAIGSLFLISTLVLASQVGAQEPAEDADGAPATPPAATSGSTQDIPKDPQGVRGISPLWEAVVQGDAAMIALDYKSADGHYRTAVTHEPQNPVGHLRMAELSLKQGQLTQAQEFITSALRFAGTELRYQAQASFLLAQLREAQKAPDDAIDSWKRYKALDGQLPAEPAQPASEIEKKGPLPPVVYTKSADERIAAIEANKKLIAEYAGVAERIKKNVEAADKATGGAK
jgi:predicted Zn-dependent protease